MNVKDELRLEKAVQHAISYAHYLAERDCKGVATGLVVLMHAYARVGGDVRLREGSIVAEGDCDRRAQPEGQEPGREPARPSEPEPGGTHRQGDGR